LQYLQLVVFWGQLELNFDTGMLRNELLSNVDETRDLRNQFTCAEVKLPIHGSPFTSDIYSLEGDKTFCLCFQLNETEMVCEKKTRQQKVKVLSVC